MRHNISRAVVLRRRAALPRNRSFYVYNKVVTAGQTIPTFTSCPVIVRWCHTSQRFPLVPNAFHRHRHIARPMFITGFSFERGRGSNCGDTTRCAQALYFALFRLLRFATQNCSPAVLARVGRQVILVAITVTAMRPRQDTSFTLRLYSLFVSRAARHRCPAAVTALGLTNSGVGPQRPKHVRVGHFGRQLQETNGRPSVDVKAWRMNNWSLLGRQGNNGVITGPTRRVNLRHLWAYFTIAGDTPPRGRARQPTYHAAFCRWHGNCGQWRQRSGWHVRQLTARWVTRGATRRVLLVRYSVWIGGRRAALIDYRAVLL